MDYEIGQIGSILHVTLIVRLDCENGLRTLESRPRSAYYAHCEVEFWEWNTGLGRLAGPCMLR